VSRGCQSPIFCNLGTWKNNADTNFSPRIGLSPALCFIIPLELWQGFELVLPYSYGDSRSGRKGRSRGKISGLIRSVQHHRCTAQCLGVLKSLRRLLSSVVEFDLISLLLLDSNARTVRLIAFDKTPGMPDVELGTQASFEGITLERVLDQQEPMYVADIHKAVDAIPELASRYIGSPYSVYIFPVSVGGKKLGALSIGSSKSEEFSADDVELMSSVAAHVAVALESALADDTAALYQHELAAERDRLKLLLDTNNYVVSELE